MGKSNKNNKSGQKKGKAVCSDGTYQTDMNIYCSYCGGGVSEYADYCPHVLCPSRDEGTIYFGKEKRCGYCHSYNDDIHFRTPRCPQTYCGKGFHSVVVNSFSYTFH